MIYTIGYARMLPAQLRDIATGMGATVIDVRGRPVSRRPGFGRRQLEALLPDAYAWWGDLLGGVHHLANAEALWPGGLARLLDAGFERPLLLCQCDAPGKCHRHLLAMLLERRGVEVTHLYYDEESNAESDTAGIWEAVGARELQHSIDHDHDYDFTTWRDPSELVARERA